MPDDHRAGLLGPAIPSPDLATLEARARELAGMLDRALADLNAGEKRVGFVLFLVEFGRPGGSLTYISSANRDDMVPAIGQWVLRQCEGDRGAPPMRDGGYSA